MVFPSQELDGKVPTNSWNLPAPALAWERPRVLVSTWAKSTGRKKVFPKGRENRDFSRNAYCSRGESSEMMVENG